MKRLINYFVKEMGKPNNYYSVMFMIYVKSFNTNYKTQLWMRGIAFRLRLQKYNYTYLVQRNGYCTALFTVYCTILRRVNYKNIY